MTSSLFYRTTTLLVGMLLMLSACGGSSTDQPAGSEPTVGILPSAAAEAPPATQVHGDNLPGRLLFVQQGTIWLWQGEQSSPLLGDGESWQPAWSPDGTRIAYIERGESYSNLMLADAKGQVLDQLTAHESSFPLHSHERIYDSMWAFYPTWSPDGLRIAIISQYGPPTGSPAFEYNLAIYTLPAPGGSRANIYSDDGAQAGKMDYTPDGSALVYTSASTAANGQQQIYRLSLDYGTSTPFPGAPERSYDPAFSPDGRWLAFASHENEQTDIWVLPGNPTDNSEPTPRRLTSLGTARAPVFSPDGKTLAFLAIPPGGRGFDVWLADLDISSNSIEATQVRQLTKDMKLDPDSGLSWAR